MMQTRTRSFIAAFLLGMAVLLTIGWTQDAGQTMTRTSLKTSLEQLGYTVKEIDSTAGKEKYSVTITRDGLDIPVGVELSGNSAYIWYTVNLGPAANAKALELLKSNATIQPSQFYITKSDLLMMGLAIENRNISNAILRTRLDSIAANVVKTEDIWKSK